MPYVQPQRRFGLMHRQVPPDSPGDLNFLITCRIKDYVEQMGLSYTTINDVIGALEGAKMEFYRRVAAPYEDNKILENGDVY